MAALSAIKPTNSGTASSGAAVSASDTIARSVMGKLGCYLEIINGNASSDTVTISDNGTTAAGNALPSNKVSSLSVTNGTSKVFFIHPEQCDPSTNAVTVTHTQTSSVTYKLYPVG